MSSQDISENGKLFASQRHLYQENKKQVNWGENSKGDTTDYVTVKQEDTAWDSASVPRHRIPGKQRMPPYQLPSPIKVPEPRRRRSCSRGRSSSQTRRGLTPEARDATAALTLPTCSQTELQQPLCVNDAVVVMVPQSYLLPMDQMPFTGDRKKGERTRSYFRKAAQDFDDKNCHVLGQKVAPLYVPRPCHGMDIPDDKTSEHSEDESDDGNNTPWGKRLSAIRVSRVKRDFDGETVSIEPPEGSLPVCARCGVVVYLAEDRRAAGRHFHSGCFKCFLCNAALDSINLHERNQEIYCKSCYIRQFGPKGYDYGPGEGALRME